MIITNRTDLITAVGDWLDRPDLAARAETFIQLAEARMNRLLRDPQMEVRTETVATGDYTALPADFGQMVSITTGNGRLSAMGSVEFASLEGDGNSGDPRYYAIVDGSIAFYPANSTAAISMVYRRRIPALTEASPTNWLLDLAPDAYLYGSLVQAESYLAEDDRIVGWKDSFDEAIGELRVDSEDRKWGAGPISPRIRRP